MHPCEAFKLLILAGDPFAPFAEHVRRLGLADRVIVREKVNDIEDYLQVADIGLYTSETESFCLGILEAMCFGCPSVSTRVGGIPEVITDGETGLLVPPHDADALAAAIVRLLRDHPYADTLGRAGHDMVHDRFDIGTMVGLVQQIYEEGARTVRPTTLPEVAAAI